MSPELKSGFMTWLRAKGKTEKTIQNYAGTGISVANAMLSQKLGEPFSFYSQTSLTAIKDASERLKSDNDWLAKDKIGKHTYSISIRLFTEYAESVFSGVMIERLPFPKPFILLAGISGTGKTRFVRKQAEAAAAGRANYCHVAVRPDWHEPSDLLGYVSRIGADGVRYVVTDVLRFMVRAWADIAESADADGHIALQTTGVPFWLCLDEMNLAPIEQYFADFLSVLETRQWEGGDYTCDPLLKPDILRQLDETGRQTLRDDLGLTADAHAFLWEAFTTKGIGIPPNLMVAGTVNMDETTHGFSRKVIDRAFTFDFGVFFPNDYDRFFTPATTFRPLTYAELTQVSREDLQTVTADPDGSHSIAFLKTVNALLKNTPFELAYRALNELLLAVVCFHPESDVALQAVWDDFLMAKVLPRIEGDSDKLGTDADGQALPERLALLLETAFSAINGAGKSRPDWFNVSLTGEATVMTECRSVPKLRQMQQRLDAQGFTAFWP